MAAMTSRQTAAKQSRTGKRPVPVPPQATVVIAGSRVRLKGPKGALERVLPEGVSVTRSDDGLRVVPAPASAGNGARMQGLARALLMNMVHGVCNGYTRALDLYGVGYRAELQGRQLNLSLGLSHVVQLALPQGLSARVEIIEEGGQKRPRLYLASHDKELLGQVAARIRSLRPPEPYKGKGVRYVGETIREKAGKSGGRK